MCGPGPLGIDLCLWMLALNLSPLAFLLIFVLSSAYRKR